MVGLGELIHFEGDQQALVMNALLLLAKSASPEGGDRMSMMEAGVQLIARSKRPLATLMIDWLDQWIQLGEDESRLPEPLPRKFFLDADRLLTAFIDKLRLQGELSDERLVHETPDLVLCLLGLQVLPEELQKDTTRMRICLTEYLACLHRLQVPARLDPGDAERLQELRRLFQKILELARIPDNPVLYAHRI